MDILLISRSEDKLKEQADLLIKEYKINVRYIPYDYSDMGPKRQVFYDQLKKECEFMDKADGIGLLINNIGVSNQYPQLDSELTDKEIADMINCNIDSTVFMSRTVLPFMSRRNKGAVLNISSGSGNIPNPYITMYSATK